MNLTICCKSMSATYACYLLLIQLCYYVCGSRCLHCLLNNALTVYTVNCVCTASWLLILRTLAILGLCLQRSLQIEFTVNVSCCVYCVYNICHSWFGLFCLLCTVFTDLLPTMMSVSSAACCHFIVCRRMCYLCLLPNMNINYASVFTRLVADCANQRWACWLKQQSSVTVYRSLIKLNKLPFSASFCSKQIKVCYFRFLFFVYIYRFIWKTELMENGNSVCLLQTENRNSKLLYIYSI